MERNNERKMESVHNAAKRLKQWAPVQDRLYTELVVGDAAH